MIYTFILLDRPGASGSRQQVRPEHKADLAAANLWPQKAGFPR